MRVQTNRIQTNRRNFKPAHRVLVCQEDEMTCQAVQDLFEADSEFQLLERASNVIAAAVALKPDLVLVDVHSPNQDGAEASRQILLGSPQTKVLAYSSDPAWETVEQMLTAGAAGYVLRSDDLDEVVRAARTVLAGGYYLSLGLLEPAECGE